MRLDANKLSSAVRLALSLGVAATAGTLGTAQAQTAADNNTDQKSQSLETIVVTGSNIRRVDIETANPVVTIDKAAITASGKLTLGDLVQDLPAIYGPNTNPKINNSGGTGFSSIGLRGLGSGRTLVLINGHRFLSGDPNAIPAALVDRIEVLTSGAGAIYGSDAIGGVVNFILRSNYQGAEFGLDYGISDHDDGQRQGYHFTFGQTTDKGSIMAGLDYNKFDQVLQGNRHFSSRAISLSSGSPTAGGGSATGKYGHIQLPVSLGSQIPGFDSKKCGVSNGSFYVARNANATGSSPSDYHCFTNLDKYNYAAVNLDQTPQERTSIFVSGTYKLTDDVEVYLDAYHNKTDAAYNLAPLPATTPSITVSKNSYYNPFGIDFGASPAYAFGVRMEALGFRHRRFETNNDQINTGLRANFQLFDKDWQASANFGYGHFNQDSVIAGLFDGGKLAQATGPSFKDPATGQILCGTPGHVIDGCTPVNAFNLGQTQAGLQATGIQSFATGLSTEKVESLDANGGLFDLPAGPMQLAVGLSHREEYTHNTQDQLATLNPDGSCAIISSQCSSSVAGSYSVKEAYAELLTPILKDMPFANSLNLILGDRYSKYSNFGSTNNWKVAIEYRPIQDLLLRGSVADIFRAPTVTNIFAGPGITADIIASDPCDHYTGNPSNAACAHVPTDGSFTNESSAQHLQFSATTSGSNYAGFPLGPEFGKSFDMGFVYDPHWLSGLSFSADIWRLYLNNTIVALNAQSILDLCSKGGGSQYCNLIQRYPSGPQQGQFATTFAEPIGNLGRIDTKGVDIGASYRLPDTDFGHFNVSFNATYLDEYNNQTAPGTSANTTYHFAGHVEPYGSGAQAICGLFGGGSVCTYPRWKALAALNWNMGPLSANWKVRYIGKFEMGYASPLEDQNPGGYGDPTAQAPLVIHYGATAYNDVSVGYNIEPINTRVDVGIDNLSDKAPPFLYANNTLNSNTDPGSFDTIGRFYWARMTVHF